MEGNEGLITPSLSRPFEGDKYVDFGLWPEENRPSLGATRFVGDLSSIGASDYDRAVRLLSEGTELTSLFSEKDLKFIRNAGGFILDNLSGLNLLNGQQREGLRGLSQVPVKEPIDRKLQTVEGAQSLVDEALGRIRELYEGFKTTGQITDMSEPVTPDLERALDLLEYTLLKLPKGVACVSVNISFPKVEREPENRDVRGERLKSLQRSLRELGKEHWEEMDGKISCEFVVLPPISGLLAVNERGRIITLENFPHKEQLTVRFLTPGRINLIEIIPVGFEKAHPDRDLSFLVPLTNITGIRLNRERKPLTPGLRGRRYIGYHNAETEIVEVSYRS